MILKGNQRGGGQALAVHLLNAEDNEHIHVHETRGFVADDLPSAFHEAQAISRGTRAKQYLFSLSLNPPRDQNVSTEAFERAIDKVERKLGLENQPRAIVFHEKDGRRHAHAVWSRIDAGEMKAINLPHYKLKLREVSKALYAEHGWQMPRGLIDRRERDPANFSHAEWQQAKRGGHDPKALKTMFQDCWAASDSGKAFAQALKARGYILAKGDKRGHVAVDYRGEVYAVAKYVGLKVRQVRDKLGDPEHLPNLAEAQQEIASRMTGMLKRHIAATREAQRDQAAAIGLRKAELIVRQRAERARMDKAHADRWAREAKSRQEQLRAGWRGLWDRVTGKRSEMERRNEQDAWQCMRRDRAEKDRLIFAHLDERKALHHKTRNMRREHATKVVALHRDVAGFHAMRETSSEAHHRPSSQTELQRLREARAPHDRDRTPERDR